MFFKKRTKPEVIKECFLSHKKFKEILDEKEKYKKTKLENERERVEQLTGKVSFDLKQLPVPLPGDFETFEKMLQINAKTKDTKSQKKSLGFGVGSRLPLSDKEKWALKVEKYNRYSAKALDPKNDTIPSPMAYDLIANWAGKKSKKDKENQNQKLPNIFKSVSKGPSISPYYVHF